MRRALRSVALVLAVSGCGDADRAFEAFCLNNPGVCTQGDAGAGDAGPLRDSGSTSAGDAGAPTDAGPLFDAGSAFDAGVIIGDAGLVSTWPTIDAGPAPADGGWYSVSSALAGAPVRVFAVDPADEKRLFAATNGGVFVSTTGGASWAEVPEMGTDDMLFVGFAPSDPSIVYAASAQRLALQSYQLSLWVSVDRGRTWAAKGGPMGVGAPLALVIDPLDPKHLFISFDGANSTGKVMMTTNGTAAGTVQWFTAATGFSATALWMTPTVPSTTFALAREGFYQTQPNGTFLLLSSGAPGSFNPNYQPGGSFVPQPDGGLPYLLRYGGGIGADGVYQPSLPDAGPLSWQRLSVPYSLAFAAGPNDALYSSNGTDVQVSTDHASSWSYLPGLPRSFFVRVFTLVSLPSGALLAASGTGVLANTHTWSEGPWRYESGVWTTITSGLCTNTPLSVSADPASPSVAYALIYFEGGFGEAILQTSNAGASWFSLSKPTNAFPDTLVIDPFDSQHLLASDSQGKLWESASAGPPWSMVTEAHAVLGVAFDPAHSGMRAVTVDDNYKGVQIENQNGTTITNLPTNGAAVLSLAFPRKGGASGDVVASSSAAVMSLRDGGVTFSSFALPNCVSLVAATPDLIACVGRDGKLQRSTNGGTSWLFDSATPYAERAWLNEADGLSMFVAAADGGVWFSSGPSSGEDRSKGLPEGGHIGVSSLSQSRASPNVIYAAPNKRGIYRTATFGR